MLRRITWILLVAMTAALLLWSCSDSGGGDDDDDDSGDDDDNGGDDDDSGGDTTPPVIESVTELPNTDDQAGPYPVEARITDDTHVAGVRLYYAIGDAGYEDFWMAPFGENGYRGQIPGQESGTVIRYFVKAWDDALNEAYAPEGAPDMAFVFHVKGTMNLIYDDGESDTGRGVSQPGDCLVVRFTPPSYPAQFTQFSSMVWDYHGNDDRVRPIVLYDPTSSGGPPLPMDALWRGETQPPGYWRQFYHVDLTNVVELQDPIESGEIYLGWEYIEMGEVEPLSYGFDTDDPSTARAWYWDQSRLTWWNLDRDSGVPGNLLFRAQIHLE